MRLIAFNCVSGFVLLLKNKNKAKTCEMMLCEKLAIKTPILNIGNYVMFLAKEEEKR